MPNPASQGPIGTSRDRDLGDYIGLQKELRKSIATHDSSNLDSPSILKLPVYHYMYIKQLVQLQ